MATLRFPIPVKVGGGACTGTGRCGGACTGARGVHVQGCGSVCASVCVSSSESGAMCGVADVDEDQDQSGKCVQRRELQMAPHSRNTLQTFSMPLLCAADTRNGLLNTPRPDPAIIMPTCRRFSAGDVGMACRVDVGFVQYTGCCNISFIIVFIAIVRLLLTNTNTLK